MIYLYTYNHVDGEVLPELNGKIASTIAINLAAIYMNQGENDLAKEYFTVAITKDSENPTGHLNLGIILTSKFQSHVEAIKHCAIALKLDPHMIKALHLMGNILQTLGKDIEAEKYFVLAENEANQQSQDKIATNTDLNNNNNNDSQQSNNKPAYKIDWTKYPLMNAKIGDEFVINSKTSSDSNGDTVDTILKLTCSCISERPFLIYISKFLKDHECEHIIHRATSQLEKSFVMGGQGNICESENEGKNEKESTNNALYRSSYNAWLHADKLATLLQRRLADVTGFPLQLFQQKSEDLQVVKYEAVGQQFKAHHDSSAFHPRFLTALLYMNDVPEGDGGETWFPFSGKEREFDMTIEEAISSALHQSDNFTCASNRTDDLNKCPQTGLLLRPVKGDAVIFFNHLKSGAIDSAAVHAGLPMISKTDQPVEKWISNYWVEHNLEFLFPEE